MKLIVGLGNPGSRYQETRHNVGFDVVDELARRLNLDFGPSPTEAVMAKESGHLAKIMLAKPLTFMNRSGLAVGELARYYRIGLDDLLIVSDDVNLPLGRLRVRPGGSDGGHNGLRSIIELFSTDRIARLRVGIGRGERDRDLADYVLAGFEGQELGVIKVAISRAADAAELFVREGIESAMNSFNQTESTLAPPYGDGSEQEH